VAATCLATGRLEQAREHWQQAVDIYADLDALEAARMGNDPTQAGQVPAVRRSPAR